LRVRFGVDLVDGRAPGFAHASGQAVVDDERLIGSPCLSLEREVGDAAQFVLCDPNPVFSRQHLDVHPVGLFLHLIVEQLTVEFRDDALGASLNPENGDSIGR
jgi:hypothetical protein